MRRDAFVIYLFVFELLRHGRLSSAVLGIAPSINDWQPATATPNGLWRDLLDQLKIFAAHQTLNVHHDQHAPLNRRHAGDEFGVDSRAEARRLANFLERHRDDIRDAI